MNRFWRKDRGPHYHHCRMGDHPFQCPVMGNCYLMEGADWECDACKERRLTVASLLYPAVCDRCRLWKRTPDGRALYVTYERLQGKRMVCPACQETERILRDLGQLTGAHTDEDESVPF